MSTEKPTLKKTIENGHEYDVLHGVDPILLVVTITIFLVLVAVIL
jgi:hypothetical protein